MRRDGLRAWNPHLVHRRGSGHRPRHRNDKLMVDVFGNFDGFVGFCDDDLTQKPKADLTADYANFTDTIGYDY